MVEEKDIVGTEPLTDTGKWVKRLLLEKMEQRRLLEQLVRLEQERNERERTRPDLWRIFRDVAAKFIGDYDRAIKK